MLSTRELCCSAVQPPQPAALAHPVVARFLEQVQTSRPNQTTTSTAATLSAQMATSYGSPAVPKSKVKSRQAEREADIAKLGEASCKSASVWLMIS